MTDRRPYTLILTILLSAGSVRAQDRSEFPIGAWFPGLFISDQTQWNARLQLVDDANFNTIHAALENQTTSGLTHAQLNQRNQDNITGADVELARIRAIITYRDHTGNNRVVTRRPLMRVHNVLFTILAMAAVDTAQAQDPLNFKVDGDPMDWRSLANRDERSDVVPDTNSTVDLRGYEFGGGRIFHLSGEDSADTLFTFLFDFIAAPFQGAEETTVEIFFDLSVSDTYGVEQGPWSGFRPDYVVGVTGSNGALTKEFYWRWTGRAWDKSEGADIPELEVALRSEDAGGWLEGALDWKRLDIPDTDRPHWELKGAYNSLKAVRVSKGEFRDYVPDSDQPPLETSTLPPGPTDIEGDSWGRIKGQ